MTCTTALKELSPRGKHKSANKYMNGIKHAFIAFVYCGAGVQENEWPILLGVAREAFQKSLLSLKRYVIDPLLDEDRKDSVPRQKGLILAMRSSPRVARELKGCDRNVRRGAGSGEARRSQSVRTWYEKPKRLELVL